RVRAPRLPGVQAGEVPPGRGRAPAPEGEDRRGAGAGRGAPGQTGRAAGGRGQPQPGDRAGEDRPRPAVGRLHGDQGGAAGVPAVTRRVAAVDQGENFTRLLVADVDDGHVDEVRRLLTITRLGDGVDRSGRLSEKSIGRV